MSESRSRRCFLPVGGWGDRARLSSLCFPIQMEIIKSSEPVLRKSLVVCSSRDLLWCSSESWRYISRACTRTFSAFVCPTSIQGVSTSCFIYTLHHDKYYRTPFLAALFVLASSSFKFEFLAPDRLPSPSKRSSPSEPTAGFVTVLHVHRSRNSGSRVPSSASTILSPRTGKNLYPCPLPPVARKRPSHSGW